MPILVLTLVHLLIMVLPLLSPLVLLPFKVIPMPQDIFMLLLETELVPLVFPIVILVLLPLKPVVPLVELVMLKMVMLPQITLVKDVKLCVLLVLIMLLL